MSENNLNDDLLGPTGVAEDLELTLKELQAKYPDLKANKKAAALKELGLEAPKPGKTPEQLEAEKEAKAKAKLEAKIQAAQLDGTVVLDEDGEPQKVKNTYVPKNTEAHLFHVELDKPNFDKVTGRKKSKAYTQKFTVPDYNNFKKHIKGHGFTARVLWNPLKFK